MSLFKSLILTLFLLGNMAFPVERTIPATPKEELAEIDDQIQELEDLKRGYESRALRHEDQAQRLQYNDRSYLEARRHLELAQVNRDKAALVQKEIDRLKARRKQLLDTYQGEDGFEDL